MFRTNKSQFSILSSCFCGQRTDDEDLAISSSMTWIDEECQVCFTCFDESRTSYDGFSSSVAIITCGHSFCRRCWQHHLMASVLEGQTTVLCMVSGRAYLLLFVLFCFIVCLGFFSTQDTELHLHCNMISL